MSFLEKVWIKLPLLTDTSNANLLKKTLNLKSLKWTSSTNLSLWMSIRRGIVRDKPTDLLSDLIHSCQIEATLIPFNYLIIQRSKQEDLAHLLTQ